MQMWTRTAPTGMRQRCSDIARYPAVDRAAGATREVLRGCRWRVALGGLDAESLSFEIEPFSRQAEHRRGLFDSASALLERVLHHRLLEMPESRWHRLIETDNHLCRFEYPLGRRDRAA